MGKPCDECGWAEAGGRSGCRARFEEYLACDFSHAPYFRSHRMFVDTYCLQHPDQFWRSAKSFAAHFAGLGWLLEAAPTRRSGPTAFMPG